MDVFEELVRLRAQGRKCALATIIDVRGSIPSYETAKLLVRDDGTIVGTVGGGASRPMSGIGAGSNANRKAQRLTFTWSGRGL